MNYTTTTHYVFTTTTTGAGNSGTSDGVLIIEVDTDNVNESDNALIQLTEDGGLVNGYIGFDGINNLYIEGTCLEICKHNCNW